METNDLKDIDICNIIKTCAKSGVTELIFGTLKVNFKQPGMAATETWPGMVHAPPESGTTAEQVKKLALTTEDQELLDELAETQVMMDDPDQFEQSIIDHYLHQDNGVVDGDSESRHSQTQSAL